MKKVVEIISKGTKFPTEVISSTPKLEITGNNSIYIENHKGIKILTSDEIVVKLQIGFLIVQGKKFLYVKLTKILFF